MRESPAMEIVHRLAVEKAGRIIVVEPHVKQLPKSLVAAGAVELAALELAVARADVVVLLVNHREFAAVDRRKLDGKAVVDTRGIWC